MRKIVAFSVVTGMPKIGTEFEFDFVVCFCISLAPYAVFFHSDLPSTHCMDCPVNTMFVCPSVRPSYRSQFVNIESYLQPFGIA